jgi:hypothetical protein
LSTGNDKYGDGPGGSKATPVRKQPVVQPLGKVPTNSREEAESIVLAVAVFGFFMTGEQHCASSKLPHAV